MVYARRAIASNVSCCFIIETVISDSVTDAVVAGFTGRFCLFQSTLTAQSIEHDGVCVPPSLFYRKMMLDTWRLQERRLRAWPDGTPARPGCATSPSWWTRLDRARRYCCDHKLCSIGMISQSSHFHIKSYTKIETKSKPG